MIKKLNYRKYIKNIIFPESKYLKKNNSRKRFKYNIFKHNNSLIIIISYFLFFEQLYYGYFVRNSGSLYQKVHLFSAFLMLIFALISSYLFFLSKKKINLFHNIFVISFGLTGFIIAIVRTIIFQNSIFTLPTIYIAVNYGLAAAIYLHPAVSFIIYSTSAFSLIYLFPIFQSELVFYSYIPDIISNAIIAWIISAANYHRYLNSFVNKLKVSETNKKLKKISSRDPLTNLYNRRKLDEFLEQELNRNSRYQIKFSIIIIDIDNFKEVNDNYSHNVGDQVLVKFSHLLKANIRDIDKAGRWGGEEFLIIVPETNINSAAQLAEKLRRIIVDYNFNKIGSLSASFGVAEYQTGETIYQLVNRADKLLYKAKRNGKNKVLI